MEDAQITEFDGVNKKAVLELRNLKSSFKKEESRTRMVGQEIAPNHEAEIDKIQTTSYSKENEKRRQKLLLQERRNKKNKEKESGRTRQNIKKTIRIRKEVAEYIIDRKRPIFEKHHIKRTNEGFGSKLRYIAEDHDEFTKKMRHQLELVADHIARCENLEQTLKSKNLKDYQIGLQMRGQVKVLALYVQLLGYHATEIAHFIGEANVLKLNKLLSTYKD